MDMAKISTQTNRQTESQTDRSKLKHVIHFEFMEDITTCNALTPKISYNFTLIWWFFSNLFCNYLWRFETTKEYYSSVQLGPKNMWSKVQYETTRGYISVSELQSNLIVTLYCKSQQQVFCHDICQQIDQKNAKYQCSLFVLFHCCFNTNVHLFVLFHCCFMSH